MTAASLHVLRTEDLEALCAAASHAEACESCAALVCPGWESLPATFERACLELVGTLRQPSDDDPTVEELHPAGTNAWSADAPIAPAYFPYNRCEVWRCAACARPFLRYTEYGGYYHDERIRVLDARLLDGTRL